MTDTDHELFHKARGLQIVYPWSSIDWRSDNGKNYPMIIFQYYPVLPYLKTQIDLNWSANSDPFLES